MQQVDGLCSPGSASSSSAVRISLGPQSSQTVTFPAVPMKIGEIPITIELYKVEKEEIVRVDAIQKMLLVKVRGTGKLDHILSVILIYTYILSFFVCLRMKEWK